MNTISQPLWCTFQRQNPTFPACWLIVSLMILLHTGCRENAGYTPVDFSQTVHVDRPRETKHPKPTLRVAIAAIISPKETLSSYRDLLDYIGDRLEVNIHLVQRKTYGEINALFQRNEIDIAFICSGPYALGKETFGFESLATPVVRGEPFYRAYLMVNIDSPVSRMEDLRGRMFAFTDPESNTGKLVPTFWLHQIGEKPEDFFSRVIYTHSHDNSIMAVARNLVDGAAVDSHVFEYFKARNPEIVRRIRVIKKSMPFGSPPFVAAPHLSEELKARLRAVILAMHADPDGQSILQALMIDRFVPPRDEWYESVSRIKQQLETRVSSIHEDQ